jgi:beta-galactosidase/beta-glucuronidase
MNQNLLADTPWQLEQRKRNLDIHEDIDSGNGLEAAGPGNVYQTLLQHGRIPDPFYGTNERKAQWIVTTDWLCRREFQVDREDLGAASLDLRFDKLNTLDTAYLIVQRVYTLTYCI